MDGIIGVAVIVHVRLVSGIVALVAQGFFVHPQEVLMGREQVVVIVQLGGVRHVVGDKIVESTQRTGIEVFGGSGWLVHETGYGSDIFLAVGNGHVGPLASDGGFFEGASVVGAGGDFLGEEGFDFGAG